MQGWLLAEQGKVDEAAGAAAELSGIAISPPKLQDSVFIPWGSKGVKAAALSSAVSDLKQCICLGCWWQRLEQAQGLGSLKSQ